MSSYKFGVTGQERKSFVGAISEILNAPVNYLGVPTFAFEVGGYHIDKEGTVTGKYDLNLFACLAKRGYEPEPGKTFHLITPRGTLLIQERFDTAGEAEEAGYGNYFHHKGRDVYIKTNPDGATEHSKLFALVGAPFTPESPAEEATEEPVDFLTIEMPLDGFNPESLDNLVKLVESKAVLIKKALGADDLPIQVLEDRIAFPWFPICDNTDLNAYRQFVTALCATAREKKRVTAKPQESFENEKFALRVWLIGLGLVGKEYGAIRKLMMANLSGNSSWRYGKPEKAGEEATPAPETAEEAPAEEALVEPAPEKEAALTAEESEADSDK